MREGKPPVILPRCVTRRSESSCFALHVNGHWRIGQPRAATLGIAVTGTLGIVAVARRRGLHRPLGADRGEKRCEKIAMRGVKNTRPGASLGGLELEAERGGSHSG